MRDLVRGREDAVNATRKARQRLSAFVLRHGFRYSGGNAWSVAHLRWLADIKMPHPAQQITLQEYIHSIEECSERVDRLTEQILKLIPTWRMAPVVTAFQALRGVAPIVATTMVVEIGDLRRFENPRQLMAYLGLVPSENSSGQTTKRGGITKTGNGHARRALIEAAQAYSFPARVSRALRKRQEGLPREIKEISWKAQVRLCGTIPQAHGQGKEPKQDRNRDCTRTFRVHVGHCQRSTHVGIRPNQLSKNKTAIKENSQDQIQLSRVSSETRPRSGELSSTYGIRLLPNFRF